VYLKTFSQAVKKQKKKASDLLDENKQPKRFQQEQGSCECNNRKNWQAK